MIKFNDIIFAFSRHLIEIKPQNSIRTPWGKHHMEKQTKNLGEQMSWEFWPVSAEFDNMYETLRGN